MTNSSKPLIPTSVGELIDKITILKIKEMKLSSSLAYNNVKNELDALHKELNSLKYNTAIQLNIEELAKALIDVNIALWVVEDELRVSEKASNFGVRFITNARSVYLLNDKRAALKKAINIISGSALVEEKSYH